MSKNIDEREKKKKYKDSCKAFCVRHKRKQKFMNPFFGEVGEKKLAKLQAHLSQNIFKK